MQNQNFKKIMQLEIDVTNKLFSYMQARIDLVDVFEKFDTDFLQPNDDKGNLAFNLWLSIDYIDKNGKSFAEKMLEDRTLSLTRIENDVLKEKASSYVSLYEIIAFEDHYVVLKDALIGKEYRVLEPSINNLIEIGEFLFTRIGKVLDNHIFMGDINYLPSLAKDYFLEELLIDYNLNRKNQKNLSMSAYLKRYSINLYRIYNELLMEIIENDLDINSLAFDELDEFEEFLLSKYKDIAVKKHINNLTNIFDYALSYDDTNLCDIDNLDLGNFFNTAIDDNFINSQEEFNSYLATLKNYLQFLSMGNPKYKDYYNDVLLISKDRFKYMSKLDRHNSFNLDSKLAHLINFKLNDQALSLLMDYDKFMLFISDIDLKLTSTKKHIKRKDLLQLNQLFDNEFFVNKKAPNQEDFFLINLFYYASLNNNIFEVDGSDLVITSKGYSLLRLSDEEKYVLLVQYLLGKDFIKLIYAYSNNYVIESAKDDIIEVLANLKTERPYTRDEFPLNGNFVFFNYINYLLVFGLMNISYDPTLISITSLGNKVFNYLTHKKDMIKDTRIIRLDDFKREKNGIEG